MRFTEAHADQARAAGVLLEFEHGRALICDRSLYRELCKQAIADTLAELVQRKADRTEQKATQRAEKATRPKTPADELASEHRASVREHARAGHAANLDLGSALLTELARVPADSIDVARFFGYGLLGPESSSYLGTSDHTARVIAANGIRLVLDEHRSTETPKLKSGKPGKTTVTYADVEQATAWMWKFVDGAKTAEELYGRVLVCFAAEHYAYQTVLPTSKRQGSVLPSSHNDIARKAFARLTKSVLPGSYTQLQRAIDREAREHDKKLTALHQPATPADDEAPEMQEAQAA